MNNIITYNKFLKGEMNDEESHDFTRFILTEYFEEEKLKSKWEAILQNKKQHSGSDPQNEIEVKRKGTSFRLIGSLLVLAASLTLVFLVQYNDVDTAVKSPVDQLLSQHYSKPYNREVFKGSMDEGPNLVYNAFQLYQQGNYESAIPLFEEIVSNENASEDVRFYLGLSYLYSRKSNEAFSQFEWVLNQDRTSYADAATWFAALALTDAEKYTEARKYLSEVAQWNQNKGRRELASKAKILIEALD